MVAAVINVILNILLIPPFAETGAAVSTLISEFSVLVAQVWLGRLYIPFRFVDIQVYTYLFATMIMTIGILPCMMFDSVWLQIFLGPAIGAVLYATTLYIKHDTVLQEIMAMVFKVRS